MKKKSISYCLSLSLLASIFISASQPVLAVESKLSNNIESIQEIDSKITTYDIIKKYTSYQGSSVSHSYTEKKSNGDTYYYKGTLEYIGRENGLFGNYVYLGDKRKFTLYKIVTSSGNIITPNFIES